MANIQLADNLKRYREYYGFTQQTLADKINISRQAYSNYETGKRAPDMGLLTRLCDIYSISLDQLVRQPFSYEIKESTVPYQVCYRQDSDDTLYLTDEEIHFVLEYRGAEWERRHLISYVLQHTNNTHGHTVAPPPPESE
ncbi:MAG: helix-turn-helix transcriptional regulator [Ruminococcus sp.]|jgi:transcriptional regulator with XRE-family HTH domain|nr:helix-turn-helix transcriptional regulator [Ruminococcus sp.]